MLKRDIFEHLERWRVSSHRKPLLLRGARQVGKTTVLRRFGRDAYEKMFYLNFEEDPRLDDFFSQRLHPDEIIRNLSVHFEQKIYPEKHLIIFDEIQASNRALTALKYFREQAPEYHLAAAGSLIGVTVSRPPIRSTIDPRSSRAGFYSAQLGFPPIFSGTGSAKIEPLVTGNLSLLVSCV